MSKLTPERVWWHTFRCGAVVASSARPDHCKCGPSKPGEWEDLGYRVGFNSTTHSYYGSYDAALKDKRCR